MAAMSRIKDKINEQSSTEQLSNEQDSSSSMMVAAKNQNTRVIRVETAREPQIGKFNGDPADWPAFRDLFLAEVHNKSFDPVTKLLYLQAACVGKAAATLGPWSPVAGNYAAAWDVLVKTYNDNYHVIHSILGRMNKVKRQDLETHDTLRLIMDSLTSGTRQLETIAPQGILWDQLWIHYARQRLPRQTLDSWEQYRNRDGETELPTLAQFKHFIDVKAKGRREFEGNELIGQEQPVEKKNSRYQPYEKSFHEHSDSRQCIMTGCTSNHGLHNCDIFKELSRQERWEVVYQHNLCKCCLKQGHSAARCTQHGCNKCPNARTKHHVKLCHKKQEGRGSSEAGSL